MKSVSSRSRDSCFEKCFWTVMCLKMVSMGDVLSVRLHKWLKLIQVSLVDSTEVIEQSVWLTSRLFFTQPKSFPLFLIFR